MYILRDYDELVGNHSREELIVAARANLQIWDFADETGAQHLKGTTMSYDLAMKIVNDLTTDIPDQGSV